MALEDVKPENTFPITTFRYNDADYPIWKKHTVKRLAYDIVNVNEKTIYTPVNMLGQPGWGKTTVTQELVHDIHEIAPYFSINWHFKEDILKVDKILERLPKYKPAILIFDDISWILQNKKLMPSDRKYELLHKLTTVREILDPENKRTQCILLMDFHYSFAVEKAFRQSPFSVQVSITNEERENYLKTIGHSPMNRRRINSFVRILESAYKYNTFNVPAPPKYPQKKFYYKTEQPFRPAMVFNMSQIHLMLFHKVNCEKCSPKKTYDKPDPKWLVDLVNAEGIDRVHRVWRFYTALTTGKVSLLHKKDQRIVRHLRDEVLRLKLPMEEIEDILKDVKQAPKQDQEKLLLDKVGALEGREINNIDTLASQINKGVKEEDVTIDQDDIEVGEEDGGGMPAYQIGNNDEDEEEGEDES